MIDKERFKHAQDGFGVVFAFVTLVILGITPFYLLHLGRQLLDKPFVLTERQKRSYELLFSTYRLKERRSIRFSAMFFFRRFFMLFVIVLLPEQRNIQIVSQLWSTLFIMSYTAHLLPYKNFVQSVQEIINEWTVLVAAYHLFTFTELVYDEGCRFTMGWSLLAVIGLNVAFNFTVLAIYVISDLVFKIKTKCRKMKH